MSMPSPHARFAICIENTDYPVALEIRKIYRMLPDEQAARRNLIRIIDESGEDYLYPRTYFIVTDFPPAVAEALLNAA